jgi:hypothetical protein
VYGQYNTNLPVPSLHPVHPDSSMALHARFPLPRVSFVLFVLNSR